MNRAFAIGAACVAGLLTAAHPAAAQRSSCADCHYANPAAPNRQHLDEWDRSPHGRNDVACEKCHGGNEKEFEGALAHRGVLDSRDPASPVNPVNLPDTCGQCHVGPSAAFRSSRHFELLRSGSSHGPTCSTCHGDVDGRVLTPKALESACNTCHGPGENAPRPGRAALVREEYERVGAVRDQIKQARSMIARVTDRRRRDELNRSLSLAESAVTRAVDAGHMFVYDDLKEYRTLAERRLDTLFAALANR
jgi:hypothetical protein